MVGHRSTVPNALGALALLFCLAAAPVCAPAYTYPPPLWETPGPIASALSLPDGDRLNCEAVAVDRICARNNPAYFIIRDPHSPARAARIVVLCSPPSDLRREQMIDVVGAMATLLSGERCIVQPTIYARFDERGEPCAWDPLYWLMPEPRREYLPISTSRIPPSDPSLDDDGLGLAGPVTAYSSESPLQAATVHELLSNPPLLFTSVTLKCKPVVETGDGWILVGDDNSDSAVKVYTSIPIKPTDRVISLLASAHSENGRLVLYADSGPEPYFDPQAAAGYVQIATYGTVAWARTMPDLSKTALASDTRSLPKASPLRSITALNPGPITLPDMVVTAVFYQPSSSTIDCFYSQRPHPDMQGTSPHLFSGGIKVVPPSCMTVAEGDVLGICGTVCWGDSSGEYYLEATTVTKTGVAAVPKPYGMANISTVGGESGAQPALWPTPSAQAGGINPVGARVRVWGALVDGWTSNGQTIYYLNDGSGLARSTQDGLKVVYYRSGDAPDADEYDMVTVTGVLGAEMDGSHPVPIIRVANKRVIHVRTDGNDFWDGCRWETAKATVQEAITTAAASAPKCEVWVSAGTYTLTSSVELADGVAVYGGFAGNETSCDQRNWVEHETILDPNWTCRVISAGSTVTSAARIDGFVIQHGSAVQGGGVYCSGCSGTITIANNRIRSNSAYAASEYSPGMGAGLYSANCPIAVTGNVFEKNEAAGTDVSDSAYGGAVYCCGTSNGIIANNTIVRNTVRAGYGGDSEGGGFAVECTSPPITANNIIAFNTGDGIYNGGTAPVLFNNDLHRNTGDAYDGLLPGASDLDDDPGLLGLYYGDCHIKPSSPCRDAGCDSCAGGATDFDGQDRTQGTHIDIGADESDGCGSYSISFTCDPEYSQPTGSVDVTAHISDWDGNVPDPAALVTFSIDGGSITHINDQSVSGPPWEAYSGSSTGNVKVTITRSTVGAATLTATVSNSCGAGSTSKGRSVWFGSDPSRNWPMFMHDPQHTSLSGFVDTTTTETLTTPSGWGPVSVPTAQEDYLDLPLYDSSPAVWSGKVIVGAWNSSSNGAVLAYSATTGQQVWDTSSTAAPTAMGGVASSPAVYPGKVYVGSADGNVYCFAFDDGTLIWSAAAYESTPAPIYSSPVVYGDTVYIASSACAVYAFDANTGARVWSQPVYLSAVAGSYSCVSSPCIAQTTGGDYLLVGCSDAADQPGDQSNLSRVNLATRECTSICLGASVLSSPTVAGDYGYVGCSRLGEVWTETPNFYKLCVDPFEIVDQGYLQHETNASPAYAYGDLYLGDDTGHTFYQFDESDLSQLVSSFDADTYFLASAALTNTGSAGGIVYVGNDDGRLYALDAGGVSPPELAKTATTGGRVRSTPAVAYIADESDHLDRWVFVTTRGSGGRLLAFRTDR